MDRRSFFKTSLGVAGLGLLAKLGLVSQPQTLQVDSFTVPRGAEFVKHVPVRWIDDPNCPDDCVYIVPRDRLYGFTSKGPFHI